LPHVKTEVQIIGAGGIVHWYSDGIVREQTSLKVSPEGVGKKCSSNGNW